MHRRAFFRTGSGLLLLAAALTGAGAAVPQALPSSPAPLQPAPPDDPVERLTRYLRLLADDPHSLSALTGAGRAALEVGDASAAVGFYARAQEAAPGDGRVKAGLAAALVQLEQPRDALKLFDKAKDLGIPEAEFAADRGLAYDLRGDGRRAQADYRLAIARGGGTDETVRRLALSLAMAGDRAGALAVLDPLLRRQDRAAWRASTFVLAMTGDVPAADARVRLLMTSPQAQSMQPFLARLAALSPAEQAAAVHFGHFPTPGAGQGRATQLAAASLPRVSPPDRAPDRALVPSGTALGTPAAPVRAPFADAFARSPGEARAARRRPGQGDEPATRAAAPVTLATALPPVPVRTTPSPLVTSSVVMPRPMTAAAIGLTVSSAQPASGEAVRERPSGSVTLARPALPGASADRVPVTAQPAPAPQEVRTAAPDPGTRAASGTTLQASLAPPAMIVPNPPAASIATAVASPALPTPVQTVPPPSSPLPPASSVQRTAPPQGAVYGPPASLAGVLPSSPPEPIAVQGMPATAAVPATQLPSAQVAVASRPGDAAPTTPVVTGEASRANATAAPPVEAPAATVAPVVAPPAAPPAALRLADAEPAAALDRTSPPPPAQVEAVPVPAVVAKPPPVAAKPIGDAAAPVRAGGATGARPEPAPASPDQAKAAAASAKAAREADAKAKAAKDADAKAKAAKQVDAKAKAQKAADAKAKAAKEAEAKAQAAKEAAKAAANAADEKRQARKAPERYWVQVAGGANKHDLPKAWDKARAAHPQELAGKTPHTTPLRFTNRLLVGPFKSDDEAQAFVNRTAKAGWTTFAFTSPAGQKVEPLPAK